MISDRLQKRLDSGRETFRVGISCPECGMRQNIAIDSRPSLSYTRRRRVCINGHRFTTRETVVDEGQWVPDFQI